MAFKRGIGSLTVYAASLIVLAACNSIQDAPASSSTMDSPASDGTSMPPDEVSTDESENSESQGLGSTVIGDGAGPSSGSFTVGGTTFTLPKADGWGVGMDEKVLKLFTTCPDGYSVDCIVITVGNGPPQSRTEIENDFARFADSGVSVIRIEEIYTRRGTGFHAVSTATDPQGELFTRHSLFVPEEDGTMTDVRVAAIDRGESQAIAKTILKEIVAS